MVAHAENWRPLVALVANESLRLDEPEHDLKQMNMGRGSTELQGKIERMADSLDRLLIASAVASGERNVAINSGPIMTFFGTRLIEGELGGVKVGFVVPDAMTRGKAIVSGGALAVMLDTAMVVALFPHLAEGQSCTSISFTVNMLRAARGSEFTAEGVVDKLGGRVCFATARLYDIDQCLVASATSALAIVPA